jgi:hypothetical protein
MTNEKYHSLGAEKVPFSVIKNTLAIGQEIKVSQN